MTHFLNIYKKLERAMVDLEKFTIKETKRGDRFIYRYGFFTSEQNEANLVCFSQGESKKRLEGQIKSMDKVFHIYTDTRFDISFSEDTYYLTYVVLFPFDKDVGNEGTTVPLF